MRRPPDAISWGDFSFAIFSNLGRTMGRKTHGNKWEKTNEARIQKFGEYTFRLCFHSTISLVGIYLFFDKPWWQTLGRSEEATTGTKYLYIDFPFQPVDPGMAWYYLVQAAYNIEVMISLLEISCYVEFQPIINTRVVNFSEKNSC